MTLKKAMAATFTEISIKEMESFIKRAFHALHPKQGQFGGIYYYDLHLSKTVAIRVWTSIKVRSESTKDVGEGSIKVRLTSLKDGKGLDGKSESIVKRTQGWRDSLTDRVESLMELYDDKAEWWDQWAATRSRSNDADSAYRREEREEQREERDRDDEERAREEDGEGDGPSEPPAAPARQYDPGRMQGGITDPQMNFLRVLMRGMTQEKWEAVGALKITGLDQPPKGPADVRGLSKGQASSLIDALKRGALRYASTEVTDFEADASTGTYDLRNPN